MILTINPITSILEHIMNIISLHTESIVNINKIYLIKKIHQKLKVTLVIQKQQYQGE